MKKITTEKNGKMNLDVDKGFSLWEDHEDGAFIGVVIDVVNTPLLAYEDIPLVVEYLSRVHARRVVGGEKKLNGCPHCGQHFKDES